MKFRTEIEPAPFARKIDHSRRGLSVGSCFAETIAGRLKRYKFPVTGNPTGVLYNPFSIAEALDSSDRTFGLEVADYVLITFGTAWVYELDGRVVANCGKRPASLFSRRRLSVGEITGRFDALMAGPLAGKQIVFTLSPVRHLKDGFEENSLSKATLRLAIAQIVENHPRSAHYFPAFEIVTDDLRDYRFYGADLSHPSAQAVEYVWDKFSAAAFDLPTLGLLSDIEKIVRATEHRPFAPDTEEHTRFRRAMLQQTLDLAGRHPELDLGAEIEFFSSL